MKNVKPGRAQRIGEQIARDLAELIPQEVRDPEWDSSPLRAAK